MSDKVITFIVWARAFELALPIILFILGITLYGIGVFLEWYRFKRKSRK